jgi:hypothetical protein
VSRDVLLSDGQTLVTVERVLASSNDTSRIRAAAESALRLRLREISGDPLDRAGRLASVDGVFLDSVPRDARTAAIADVKAGDGGELRTDGVSRPRFCSARSSCALAVNAFGPWRLQPATLSVAGLAGFTSLAFECKQHITGVRGTPPNLDVIAEGPTTLAIESKLIEYISPRARAAFGKGGVSFDGAMRRLGHSSWAAQLERLKASPDAFHFFGAAQIIKHYLGLKEHLEGRGAVLLYLYWEPLDHDSEPLFAQHRTEAASFATSLADPALEFMSMSYAELWGEWDRNSEPWVRRHADLLRRRYGVVLRS